MVVLDREADLVGDPARAALEHLTGLLDDLALALDAVEVALEADVAQPLAGVVERQAAALGERRRHRLEAVLQDAVEEAGTADGDREVGEAADVAVDGAERLRARRGLVPRNGPVVIGDGCVTVRRRLVVGSRLLVGSGFVVRRAGSLVRGRLPRTSAGSSSATRGLAKS